MITDRHLEKALNRLVAAGYPRNKSPQATLAEWRRIFSDERLDVTPMELQTAVTHFIANTSDSYGPVKPADIRSILYEKRGWPGQEPYTEPESDAPKATQQQRRSIWEQHLPPELMQRIKRRNG